MIHKNLAITQAVTPLRMIFWGGLLCVLDFTVSSTSSVNGQITSGFRFDFLNDFVGMLLITIGVSRLSKFDIDAHFRTSMRFIFACSVLNTIEAFFWHIVFQPPPLLNVLSSLLGIATLIAIVMFCTSMNRLSSSYALEQSALSWMTTRLLVIFIWVLPFGLLYLMSLVSIVTGQAFSLQLGLLAIPVLIVVLIPLIHLFMSTSRMRYEAAFDDFSDVAKKPPGAPVSW